MTFKIELGASPALTAVLARWCQPGPADQGGLAEVLKKLDDLKRQGEVMQENLQQLQQHIVVVRDNSTQLGEVAKQLSAQLKLAGEQAASNTLTPEEFAQLGSELQALSEFTSTQLAEQLALMGTVPVEEEPVPPVVEDVPVVEP